jgi:Tol biopolymer transport system component
VIWFFLTLVLSLCSEEGFDPALEGRYLTHIRQVTFPSMGFDRAGEGYFSPDGKKIIFQAVMSGENHFQIFVMDLEEMKPILVSTGKGACTCANFRPDGKKIIFASSHESPLMNEEDQQMRQGSYKWDLTPYMNIYEANPDGTDLRALTEGAAYHAECAYSHDGEEIVYASNEDGSMNLYVMKADGTDKRQVTHTVGCYNGGPFFSPDSKQILFRADREAADYLQIYVVDRNGKGERQLTANGAVNWAPYWHPNGEVIAYTTSIHGHRHYEIYLLNIRSGEEERLTHNPTFDGLPVFSPDGCQLLWTSKRFDSSSHLCLANFTMPKMLQGKK